MTAADLACALEMAAAGKRGDLLSKFRRRLRADNNTWGCYAPIDCDIGGVNYRAKAEKS
jgi:hypothetical protein